MGSRKEIVVSYSERNHLFFKNSISYAFKIFVIVYGVMIIFTTLIDFLNLGEAQTSGFLVIPSLLIAATFSSYFFGFVFVILSIFSASYFFNGNAFNTFIDVICPFLTIMIRVCVISYDEYKSNGYSKGGKKLGIRVVKENKEAYTFWNACKRNLVLYTGGFGLFFIPCFLPVFNQSGKTMLDSYLKIKIIFEEYRPVLK